MTTLAIQHEKTQAVELPVPSPRNGAISIRLAVPGADDLKFIDDLQRKHAKMVGWFPTKQLETNISKGQVLIAEEMSGSGTVVEGFTHPQSPSFKGGGVPVGYCISSDRYFKRDDCGIVYQLNVAPGRQRGLIGATLIKEVFNRAAYGCRLFCCWCAQDLEANRFWESLGFVPLAFRTGSRPRLKKDGTVSKRERIHIFWQRRIREGDVGPPTGTPYWFPAETSGGAVKENRLVLPIPPGTHWSDAKPAVLPGMEEAMKALAPADARSEAEGSPRTRKAKPIAGAPKKRAGGLWFGAQAGSAEAKELEKAEKVKKQREKPQRFRNDPKVVAAARELRDRYIEQMCDEAGLLLVESQGKYEVSRQLPARVLAEFGRERKMEVVEGMQREGVRLLEAA